MLSKDDVRYIGSLARIHLEENELDDLTRNLADILHYIEKLKTLDVKDIQPTSHVLPIKNVYREDKVLPSLPQEQALATAPNQHKGFFKVPQVIE